MSPWIRVLVVLCKYEGLSLDPTLHKKSGVAGLQLQCYGGSRQEIPGACWFSA